jgi:transposase-like protein
MRRFEDAGATVRDFCAREGLSASSFYRWRAQMGSPGGVVAVAPRHRERSLAVRPSAAGFIDLGRLAGSSRESCAGLELRLDLGGGVVLQIVRR